MTAEPAFVAEPSGIKGLSSLLKGHIAIQRTTVASTQPTRNKHDICLVAYNFKSDSLKYF